MVAGVELPIQRIRDPSVDAELLANTIFGDGVTVTNASYTGDIDSAGIYTDGDAISPEVTPGDTGVIFSTGDLRGFTNNNATESNLNTNTTTGSSGPNNVADFNQAAGASTFDAAYLDVEFTTTANVMTMQFVFASEEFPEFANSQFQDFVGVWINGTFVELSVGDGDIDPNNLDADSNSNLFISNTNDQANTEMDGFTATLTLTIPVDPTGPNFIRIGIADVGDANFDSTLLIAADSVQTTLVAQDDVSNLFPTGTRTIDLLSNDINQNGGTLRISEINGQTVAVGVPIILPTGQTITVNGDGTITAQGDGDVETVSFTYEVENLSTGDTDVGFVTLNSVPCFVRGTHILTEQGDRLVEDLRPGDMILTRDAGMQPLRWVGHREVNGTGDFAPIRILASTFGEHNELWLSPLHRVLIRDAVAELLFGETEVLVAAKDLVNDRTVCREEIEKVDYFHLLFDQHQVIISEGLPTESFLPGPQIKESFEAEIVEEICSIFPEIDPETAEGYSSAARQMLKKHEAQLLSKHLVA